MLILSLTLWMKTMYVNGLKCLHYKQNVFMKPFDWACHQSNEIQTREIPKITIIYKQSHADSIGMRVRQRNWNLKQKINKRKDTRYVSTHTRFPFFPHVNYSKRFSCVHAIHKQSNDKCVWQMQNNNNGRSITIEISLIY